jgi:hypothetical protein
MSSGPISISRAKVTTPDTTVPNARFVFLNGTAAVWVENRVNRTADRVLYATGATFIKRRTGREVHRLELIGDGEWSISPISGGCGCGARTKTYTFAQLLDPNLEHIG